MNPQKPRDAPCRSLIGTPIDMFSEVQEREFCGGEGASLAGALNSSCSNESRKQIGGSGAEKSFFGPTTIAAVGRRCTWALHTSCVAAQA